MERKQHNAINVIKKPICIFKLKALISSIILNERYTRKNIVSKSCIQEQKNISLR